MKIVIDISAMASMTGLREKVIVAELGLTRRPNHALKYWKREIRQGKFTFYRGDDYTFSDIARCYTKLVK